MSDGQLRRVALLIAPPSLPATLIETIAARRAAGDRVVLSSDRFGSPLGRRVRRVVYSLVAIAAGVVITILARDRAIAPREYWTASQLLGMSDMDATCAGFYVADAPSVFTRIANALSNVSSRCLPEIAIASPLTKIDPSQIASGTFAYTGETVTDEAFTSHENLGSFTVSRLSWRGEPAILAIRDGPFIERVSFDSLIVSARKLEPVHFASWYPTQHPVGANHADFDSNSATIRMTGRFDTTGHFPYKHSLARLPHEWMGALVIPSLPLSPSWEGTIGVAAPFHPHTHKYFLGNWESVSMKVVGREQVTVPAGTFTCWKLAVTSSGSGLRIWVDVDHHFVVRSQSVSTWAGGRFDDRVELSRYTLTTR